MLRQLVAGSIVFGLGLAALTSPQPLRAGLDESQQLKTFADRFLDRLDSGDVSGAYAMINRSVRASYPLSSLEQAQGQRQVKGQARRVFVAVRPMPAARGAPARARVAGTTLAVVCYTEPPIANFRTLSYTAVTVSKRTGSTMWIENFQTTSTPHAVCK